MDTGGSEPSTAPGSIAVSTPAGSVPTSSRTSWQSPGRARAGDLGRGRRPAAACKVRAEAVHERERVHVNARTGGRLAHLRLLPGPAAGPGPGVGPDRDRLEVDAERRRRDVGLRTGVAGPQVRREPGPGKVHRGFVALQERTRQAALQRAVDVHGGCLERRLQRARDHLPGVGHLVRRHRPGERSHADRPARAGRHDEDDDERKRASKRACDRQAWPQRGRGRAARCLAHGRPSVRQRPSCPGPGRLDPGSTNPERPRTQNDPRRRCLRGSSLSRGSRPGRTRSPCPRRARGRRRRRPCPSPEGP